MGKRSNFEKEIQKQLKGKNVKSWYEPLKMKYVTTANYIPDFVVYKGKLKRPKKPLTIDELRDNLLIEVKGFFKPSDRIKMLAVKETYPDLDIRILFQQNGYLYKNTKKDDSGKQIRRTKDSTDMKYGDWCDKHGFPWAVGEIPDDWLS